MISQKLSYQIAETLRQWSVEFNIDERAMDMLFVKLKTLVGNKSYQESIVEIQKHYHFSTKSINE